MGLAAAFTAGMAPMAISAALTLAWLAESSAGKRHRIGLASGVALDGCICIVSAIAAARYLLAGFSATFLVPIALVAPFLSVFMLMAGLVGLFTAVVLNRREPSRREGEVGR